MKNPRVSIIILNWNGWQDTLECLESVYQINYSSYNVIIVDNNSKDGSIKKIKDYTKGKLKVKSKFFNYNPKNKPIKYKEYEKGKSLIYDKLCEKLVIIKNKKNYGFAEGNNIGIRYALKNFNPTYILLLNNDTVVDKNFLKSMVNIGEMNKNTGIIGPKIYYYDKPDTFWCVGGKISWKLARGVHLGINELDQGQYEEKMEVEYVNGSSLLVKTEVLKKTGLMDKKFFLYFEESDLALRASQLGYKSVYSPKSKIWHKVSNSGGGLSKPIGLYYITRNRWIFMKKWAEKSDFLIFVIYQFIVAILFPLFLSIYYHKQLITAYYQGLWAGIKFKKRKIN